MSLIKIYVQYVWATKNLYPFLDDSIRPAVFNHIRDEAYNKNITMDFVNGYTDHVHCLVSLGDHLSVGNIAQLIKSESADWINKKKLTRTKFEWLDDYLAIGVPDYKMQVVRNYLANQKEYHKQITFQQEYNQLIKRYGFNINQD